MWRCAVNELLDHVLVLPQVPVTLREGGRTDEAEAELVLIHPDLGVTVIEVKGGTYDARRAAWRRAEGGPKDIRDPVTQAKRARNLIRSALRGSGIDANRTALRWAVATPQCHLDAPEEPVIGGAQLWDDRSGRNLPDAWQDMACERSQDAYSSHRLLKGRSASSAVESSPSFTLTLCDSPHVGGAGMG